MKLRYLTLILIALLVLAVPVLVEKSWALGDCPIQQDTNIVFYGQTGWGGVGTLSRSWVIHFLDWWESYDSSINYVELYADNVKSECDLDSFPNLKLYIQPGGNAYYQQKKLNSAGKNNILSLIDSGKAYLGICAGFYYAAGDYYWQGDYYDWSYLLGIFPTVEGSITDIADYDENPGYGLAEMSSGHQMIYYGGPTRGWRDTPPVFPGQALLTYAALPGNIPAAIKDGNMLLMGSHAEAYENDGIEGLTTEQRIENYIWLASAINDVAGTNFYHPSGSDETYCGDGVCGEGEICDVCIADCGTCGGPVENFFDGFEDGNLNGWSLYGDGSQWSASTDTSYEGSWSARAKKTGAGKDSFMETNIPSCSGTLTFEYGRRLVGLDAADDFEVSYLDGSWISVEHLGSGRANDDSFTLKSFTIPSSATKIRFKCECGAVSEKCYVDNVILLCE